MQLTEKDAAMAYAKAWNRLDCSDFIELLDDDAQYSSQWVLEGMKSKEEISEYLTGKMETIQDTNYKVYAELGNTRSGFAGRDCVFMAQGKKEEIQAVVLFEVDNNKIKKCDMCIPQLLDVERSGIYPI